MLQFAVSGVTLSVCMQVWPPSLRFSFLSGKGQGLQAPGLS